MTDNEMVIDAVQQRMSDKEMVINALSKLPDDASIQEIAREVEFFVGLEKAIGQADRGEGVSIEEARRLVREWARQ